MLDAGLRVWYGQGMNYGEKQSGASAVAKALADFAPDEA